MVEDHWSYQDSGFYSRFITEQRIWGTVNRCDKLIFLWGDQVMQTRHSGKQSARKRHKLQIHLVGFIFLFRKKASALCCLPQIARRWSFQSPFFLYKKDSTNDLLIRPSSYQKIVSTKKNLANSNMPDFFSKPMNIEWYGNFLNSTRSLYLISQKFIEIPGKNMVQKILRSFSTKTFRIVSDRIVDRMKRSDRIEIGTDRKHLCSLARKMELKT